MEGDTDDEPGNNGVEGEVVKIEFDLSFAELELLSKVMDLHWHTLIDGFAENVRFQEDTYIEIFKENGQKIITLRDRLDELLADIRKQIKIKSVVSMEEAEKGKS